MKPTNFYTYLKHQIPVMIVLSVIPGIGYLAFGYVNQLFIPALIWYISISTISIYGFIVYKKYKPQIMSKDEKAKWYKHLLAFYYIIFSLWAVIFIIYAPHDENNMHYIAIFTEIGASVVAATLLFPDKRIFTPILIILIVPLIVYFIFVGEWFAYLLALFTSILGSVLYYSAYSSNKLIHKTSYQASRDILTGLYNRQSSIEFLQESINAIKQEDYASYILLIDLDHFKIINDTLGHDVGDILLQEVASRMKSLLKDEHYVARLGGDEFIVISHTISSKIQTLTNAKTVASKLLQILKETYTIEDHQLYISASIGISLIHNANREAHEFIKEADIAMYEVKSSGKDNMFVFDQKMSERIQRHLELESILPFALENREFYLNYQPQMRPNGDLIGCEVLARWANKKYGNVSPIEFIPLAEQSNHIIKLGLFIIEEAFKTYKFWSESGIKLEQFSINLSMRQLVYHDFIPSLLLLSDKYLDTKLRESIIFEVTESLAAEDLKQLITTMTLLKRHGFRFSLDDFGTGYSSLSYLRQIPIDELKIDRSFITALEKTDKDQAMLEAIFTMGKAFKFSIVAEGVESNDQLEVLKRYDCDIIQGYYFSKPLNQQEFETFYQSHHS